MNVMAWEWVGPLVTGTIGTVTISVTTWMAHKTLRIQGDRLVKTDRRALYGKFLGALHELEHLGLSISLRQDEQGDEAKDEVGDFRKARATAHATLAEISIVGPDSVESAASDYFNLLMKSALTANHINTATARLELLREMRKDVG